MGLFEIINKIKNKNIYSGNETVDIIKINQILEQQKQRYDTLAAGKNPPEPLSEQYLLSTFATWFVPNEEFYIDPSSVKGKAYFKAINAAKAEMIADQVLFREGTKWTTEQLISLINDPDTVKANIIICGLIFQMGNFSVIKDAVYCVDFANRVPNCIAVYLLLIAQKLPQNKRTMILDAGDGVDKTKLSNALKSISICDPNWKYKIF